MHILGSLNSPKSLLPQGFTANGIFALIFLLIFLLIKNLRRASVREGVVLPQKEKRRSPEAINQCPLPACGRFAE
jgi:hypothetical protein